MAVHNGERDLPRAIESLLSQTLIDMEIVVVDDGSTDGSADILHSFGSRLRVVHQPNLGLPRALNVGIALAEGEFIARMDHDDIAESSRLARQVAFLKENPRVGLVGSAYHLIDDEGTALGTVYPPTQDSELKLAFARYCPFAHSAVMFRRALFDHVGGYSEAMQLRSASHDFDLWLRLAMDSQIANLPEPLVTLRRFPGSMSAQNQADRLRNDAILRARAIRAFGLPIWNWWYVARAWVGSLLPPTLRALLVRVVGENPGSIRRNLIVR